ncbi:condensation domain-containing protein [Yinghuangia aomiensis]
MKRLLAGKVSAETPAAESRPATGPSARPRCARAAQSVAAPPAATPAARRTTAASSSTWPARWTPGRCGPRWHALVVRHELLRTVYRVADDGEPRQVVAEVPRLDVPLRDLSAMPADAQVQAADAAAEELASRPFDLAHDQPARWELLRFAADRHALVQVVTTSRDGGTWGVLSRDLAALYRATVEGTALPAAPEIQYADVAAWERASRQRRTWRPVPTRRACRLLARRAAPRAALEAAVNSRGRSAAARRRHERGGRRTRRLRLPGTRGRGLGRVRDFWTRAPRRSPRPSPRSPRRAGAVRPPAATTWPTGTLTRWLRSRKARGAPPRSGQLAYHTGRAALRHRRTGAGWTLDSRLSVRLGSAGRRRPVPAPSPTRCAASASGSPRRCARPARSPKPDLCCFRRHVRGALAHELAAPEFSWRGQLHGVAIHNGTTQFDLALSELPCAPVPWPWKQPTGGLLACTAWSPCRHPQALPPRRSTPWTPSAHDAGRPAAYPGLEKASA